MKCFNYCFRIALVTTLILSTVSCRHNEYKEEFVLIDGKRQRVLDIGDGEPIVVFITGEGDDLTNFDSIQNVISKSTRTISYDRAGLGQSQPLDNPRTVDYLARELNDILEQMGIKDNVILVGHSLGGYIVRYFYHSFPDKVVGALLIDPGHEQFMSTVLESRTEKQRVQIDSLLEAYYASTSEGVQNEFKHRKATESMISNIPMPFKIPVTIITSSQLLGDDKSWPLTDRDKITWIELHRAWANDHDNVRHILTENSGHYIYQSEPKLVISEIKLLLTKFR